MDLVLIKDIADTFDQGLWYKLHGFLISHLSLSIIISESCFYIFVCGVLTCLLIY